MRNLKILHLVFCLFFSAFNSSDALCFRRFRLIESSPEEFQERNLTLSVAAAKGLFHSLLKESPMASNISYHGRSHVEVLADFARDTAENLVSKGVVKTRDFIGLITVAAWFHDIGYFLKSPYGTLSVDHEELSKQYVVFNRDILGLTEAEIQLVNYMIEGTDLSLAAEIIAERHHVIEKLFQGKALTNSEAAVKEDLTVIFSEFDLKNPEHLEQIYAASYGALILGTGDIYGIAKDYIGRIAGLRLEFEHDISMLINYLEEAGLSEEDIERIRSLPNPKEASDFLLENGYSLDIARAGSSLRAIPLSESAVKQIAGSTNFYSSVVDPRIETLGLLDARIISQEYHDIAAANRRLIELADRRAQEGIDDDQIVTELLNLAQELGMDCSLLESL